MAEVIEPITTSEQSLKRRRTVAPREAARKMVAPMRSIAIFGAVGALVAAGALPAYAASSGSGSADATATLQQVAVGDAQSLVVASQATASPLDRSTYSATTPEEIAEKKAEEAAKARAAAAAAAASASASASAGARTFDVGNYALVSPGSGEVRYPLPRGSYTEGRTIGGGHNGVDMLAPQGTPIYAAAAGVVRASAESIGGYGVAVMIDSVVGGQSLATTYGHMTYGSRQVQAGQTVVAGQLIGFVGSTGRSTATPLHFEVWVNGSLYEPYAWLAANAG
ncbi:M23 family metallopeptidase [Microbacterium tenebrionis]|uniref:M23 family metallopeptidase n=1 Tax=Microbacterium tenebrionis TaxID=2830665 RepID=UPI0025462C9E|nr:M23 family metallopeptidase [Microbacterium ihumii]